MQIWVNSQIPRLLNMYRQRHKYVKHHENGNNIKTVAPVINVSWRIKHNTGIVHTDGGKTLSPCHHWHQQSIHQLQLKSFVFKSVFFFNFSILRFCMDLFSMHSIQKRTYFCAFRHFQWNWRHSEWNSRPKSNCQHEQQLLKQLQLLTVIH